MKNINESKQKPNNSINMNQGGSHSKRKRDATTGSTATVHLNSNDWEQSVEYWVYQASKGENIAKCWQNIKKFISSELQREREKWQKIREKEWKREWKVRGLIAKEEREKVLEEVREIIKTYEVKSVLKFRHELLSKIKDLKER